MSQTLDFVDAGLAKRLAEAADSFRDNKYHYFVCQSAFPYNLNYTGGYDSDSEASSAANAIKQDLGDGYYIFGPYKTNVPSNETEPEIEYDSIELRFLQGTEEFHSQALSNDVDAIILSISAYDKFFQPYYVKLYGIEAAKEIRDNAVTALTSSPRIPLTHIDGKKLLGGGVGGTRITAGDYEAG